MGKQHTYTPSCFLAMFCSRKRFSSSETSRGEFVQIGKAKPDMSFATESFVIHLLLSPLTRVAADQENQVTLILHGEVYNNTEDDQSQFLKKQYLKRGESFSRDINGSFAILVIDKRNDVILLITDRVNSRKVFSSNYKGNYWLSTSLNLHPTTDVDLDIVGVASYLANGVINNDRTLFDGVRILERANIHKLTEEGFCH
ncbi:MAG: hypothetical protein HGJ97_06905, partial [Desulfosporosinus sp.]|nr:hypothetical protein [Desulfosporosinus sp.]